jgi:fructokinase
LIVVCGEALMDVIRNEDGTQRAMPGGGPFNTARALARLGVPTAFLGHLSTDKFGQELAALLAADGVSLQLASTGPQPTTIAVADLDRHGLAEYEFLVEGTSAPNLTREEVPEHLPDDCEAVHIGTLGLVLEPMASSLAEFALRERGGRLLMIDPNIRPGLVDEFYRDRLLSLIQASTIVKASQTDLAWLSPDRDYAAAADDLLAQGVGLVVVTLGADGAFGAHRDLRLRVPAPPVHVVDTIGAGDAFGAAILAWLHDHQLVGPSLHLSEDQLRSALDYACVVASITCARAGADPPWKGELIPA